MIKAIAFCGAKRSSEVSSTRTKHEVQSTVHILLCFVVISACGEFLWDSHSVFEQPEVHLRYGKVERVE